MQQENAKDLKSEILRNNTVVFTEEVHKINLDGLLLASFIKLKKGERFLDLGSGNGIIPLWLSDRGFKGESVAVELQPDAVNLIKEAVLANSIEKFSVIHQDLRSFSSETKFDAVSCNPPYFSLNGGKSASDPARAAAREELTTGISDVAAAAARNLKQHGRLYCCYPPARLQSLFSALQQFGFSPKRIRFCRYSPDKKPWTALFEARLNAREGLTVMNDFIVRRCGEKTSEYLEITE